MVAIIVSALTALFEVQANTGKTGEKASLPTVNYSSHLLADSYTLLSFEREDPMLIRINADEAFIALLASYITAEPPTAETETICEENAND